MAENSSFPQVPSTVWWGVRGLLNKSPRAALTENLLAVELNVQPAAARQYVSELRRVGLIDENSKATDVAHKWRMEDTYSEAIAELLKRNYAEELLHVASDQSDRSKAVKWFRTQGLGEGSARNKAATYFLIGSPDPGEVPTRATASGPKTRSKLAQEATKPPTPRQKAQSTTQPAEGPINATSTFPINLNMQIHISADASIEQIDAIFKSMRKHLGNAPIN